MGAYLRKRISEYEGQKWIHEQAESIAEGEIARKLTQRISGPNGSWVNAAPIKGRRKPAVDWLCDVCKRRKRSTKIVRVRVSHPGTKRIKGPDGVQWPGWYLQACYPCADALEGRGASRDAV